MQNNGRIVKICSILEATVIISKQDVLERGSPGVHYATSYIGVYNMVRGLRGVVCEGGAGDGDSEDGHGEDGSGDQGRK